jgi:RNA polymerase sigma factor (TIGR02999 family)
MAREYGTQTLQATALVHEAWLRLGGDEQPEWSDRRHYFYAIAEAMRHILVNRARRRQRIRHGGGMRRVDLEAWNWERMNLSKATASDEILLLMHDALEKFAMSEPQTAKLVKLYYFAGMTILEVAEAMELSERTAQRRLAYARALLGREIRRGLTT